MTTTTETSVTTHVHRVYIRATPEAIWEAITKPEWSARYGYGGYVDYDLRPGGTYRARASEEFLAAGSPEIVIDGEVIEADPPHKLVTTWRMLMDPETAAEGFTRITYEIKALDAGYTSLTLVHELDGAPKLAAIVAGQLEDAGEGAGGGHAWVLSDLKTLLETGATMAG
jgi:uncharacterized protein YndB with AHSA1/START domain